MSSSNRTKPKASIITRDVNEISKNSGNIYKSVFVAGKRARQIATRTKDELNNKLQEFASTVDNLEEVHENREQIEISKHYEKQPKPSMLALDEYLHDELIVTKKGSIED
ncbi:MAG: DNA-directed RNA polymerase subunit omega [Cytophagales bacterium]|nr:DNA-directed RNA polymerase subunit omega [Cytophagales bacterium]